MRLKEEAAENSRRLAVLQFASQGRMKPAAENEQWLWHVALTIATAGYAPGFNRAMLFLAEDGSEVLRGRKGIGQIDSRRAHTIWKRLQKGQPRFTPEFARL